MINSPECAFAGCTQDATQVVMIVSPCIQKQKTSFEDNILCDYTQECILGALTFCPNHQPLITIDQVIGFDLALLITKLMIEQGHAPDLDKSKLEWIPLDDRRYLLYLKMRDEQNAAFSLANQEDGNQSIH